MKPIRGLRVLVTTCDDYLWTLPPFAHLFNKYWSPKQEVVVGCYKKPNFELPSNFTIHQIDKDNYPVKRRSDGLIKFFRAMPDEHFVWMLEDFWLCAPVDADGIEALWRWMQREPRVLRVDLTVDRFSDNKKTSWTDAGKVGDLEMILVQPGTRYRWSHQGGLWNKTLMLQYMRPHEGSGSAPIEPRCTQRLDADPLAPSVYGTKNWPLKYCHTVHKAVAQMKFIHLEGTPPMPVEDIAEMRKLGLIGVRQKKFDGVVRNV